MLKFLSILVGNASEKPDADGVSCNTRTRDSEPGCYVVAGDKANRARKWAEAEQNYVNALDADPNLAPIWVQLGHARKEQGNIQGALEAYSRAIAIDRSQSDFFLQRGRAHKLAGDFAAALIDYETTLALSPDDFDARLELEAIATKRNSPARLEAAAMPVTTSGESAGSLTLGSAQFQQLVQWYGLESGRINREQVERLIVAMFSPDYYRRSKSLSERLSNAELLSRYLAADFAVGLPPGPLFDENYYRRFMGDNTDGPADLIFPPLHHWLIYGVPNRISPSPFYNDANYLTLNPDLATWPGWLFGHFLQHGLTEGRMFHPVLRLGHRTSCIADFSAKPTTKAFLDGLTDSPNHGPCFARMEAFRRSDELAELVAAAAAIDPNVGVLGPAIYSNVAPVHDGSYSDFVAIRALIPRRTYRNILILPFCKLGGADFIAGILASSVGKTSETLILRTDDSEWSRPDWFPEVSTSVDLSRHLSLLPQDLRMRVLYELIREINPEGVYNVNSRLGFETFEHYGARLSLFTSMYAYYFCADRTVDGHEVGYPVDYFANVLPYMRAAIVDNSLLAETLVRRYSLQGDLKSRVHVVYTPAMVDHKGPALVGRQIETHLNNNRRPLLLWGGRFDRQKRFDLAIEIARAMPEVDFYFWGKEVLDQPPDTSSLPANAKIHPPYKTFGDLPVRFSDGWLYTSAWDGLPTVLIECASLGIPVVASDVGGVSELITDETGFLVKEAGNVKAYVKAIEAMLADPAERRRRAENLQKTAQNRHSIAAYREKIEAIQQGGTA
jgi:glycosyltransferase involved in cell wall biosynthesis/tetratricopeptide (TPR) repeat protein